MLVSLIVGGVWLGWRAIPPAAAPSEIDRETDRLFDGGAAADRTTWERPSRSLIIRTRSGSVRRSQRAARRETAAGARRETAVGASRGTAVGVRRKTAVGIRRGTAAACRETAAGTRRATTLGARCWFPGEGRRRAVSAAIACRRVPRPVLLFQVPRQRPPRVRRFPCPLAKRFRRHSWPPLNPLLRHRQRRRSQESSGGASRSGVEVTDNVAIQDLLGRYRTAFGALDVASVRRVWPSVNQRSLERAFRQLEEQDLSFFSCTINVAGVRAEATCVGSSTFIPTVGSRSPQSGPSQWNFKLSKKSAGPWLIDEAQAR